MARNDQTAMHRTIPLLLATAVLVALAGPAARAQDPCFDMDTTAWNPGPGWETVGDCAIKEVDDIFFDADGTLYGWATYINTLDTSGGPPGVWRRIVLHPSRVAVGLLPLSTADSLVGGVGTTGWTADRFATWNTATQGYAYNLHAAPRGAFRPWRLFSSTLNGPLLISDDRGRSWRPVAQHPEGYELQATNLAFFPAGSGPWGQGYRGRTIAAGFEFGVALSDDGGDTWRRSSLWPGGRYFHAAVLARPASEGGGLRAVVMGVGPTAPNGCAAVWTSDDGGETWTARAPICEPCSLGNVCAVPRELLPLAQRRTGGAPVSGAALDWPATEWETTEAVAVMSLGGLFRTRDGGATWTREQVPIERPLDDSPRSVALSPDGRLYVGMGRRGPDGAWMLRTTEGLVVSREEGAPEPSLALAVSVRPNPSGGGPVAVTVALDRPPGVVRVVVVDAVGREVSRLHDGAAASSDLVLTLDTTTLAPGVYTVRVTAASGTGEASATARLVVSR